MQRVEPKAIQAMLDASAPEVAKVTVPEVAAPAFADSRAALDAEPLAEQCTIEDFTKVDLRVARIVSAEAVLASQQAIATNGQLGR